MCNWFFVRSAYERRATKESSRSRYEIASECLGGYLGRTKAELPRRVFAIAPPFREVRARTPRALRAYRKARIKSDNDVRATKFRLASDGGMPTGVRNDPEWREVVAF